MQEELKKLADQIGEALHLASELVAQQRAALSDEAFENGSIMYHHLVALRDTTQAITRVLGDDSNRPAGCMRERISRIEKELGL